MECGIGPAQRVITLPVNAVTTLQDKHIVWVIGKDSTAQWREVTLGVDVGGRWIIRQGITEGEQVAIEGSQRSKGNTSTKEVIWESFSFADLYLPLR